MADLILLIVGRNIWGHSDLNDIFLKEDTHVQYNRTDSVRNYDLRSVRTVKAVTNRKHLSYGPDVSVSSPGLRLIRTGHPAAER